MNREATPSLPSSRTQGGVGHPFCCLQTRPLILSQLGDEVTFRVHVARYLREGGKWIGQADRLLLLGSLVPETLGQRQSLKHFCAPAPKHRAWLTALTRALGGGGKGRREEGSGEGGRGEGGRKERWTLGQMLSNFISWE